MTFQSTKSYGHNVGFSSAFRQWRAKSHCNKIHGYALAFRFVFETEVLNDCNWVIDFGGCKSLKDKLAEFFDHKLLVAYDDPHLNKFIALDGLGLASVVILEDGVGCEMFAKKAFAIAEEWLYDQGHSPRVWLKSVEVKEHDANSAIYTGEE